MKRTKINRHIYVVPYMQTEGSFEKVSGYDVDILPWIKTFIAKRHKAWTVFEVTTGKNIHGGPTIEKAIDATRTMLENVGKAKTLEAIASCLKAPL